ncbi:HvfC family RiPP maturation protein [Lysobacter firmicutimachus]|uniref:DNA-binding domain-containing protein n=1 Tax=Lysobacter firmicutimachus TaxID=1792846 RepID=A0ABU8D080_9GAMM
MSARLQEQQWALARHLRNPQANPPPPGLQPRRLRVYRELFFNAVDGLLAGSFPVLRQTLPLPRWTGLVRAFYADHRAQTPLFPQLAAEFVAFAQALPDDGTAPAWLAELAHYEWIEQELALSDAVPPDDEPQMDLLEGVPQLSPLARVVAYRWPVAEIGPDFQPEQAPALPTMLLVYRDAAHEVRFVRLAPPAYRLLHVIAQRRARGREHLLALADEAGLYGAEALRQWQAQGLELLQRLRAAGAMAAVPHIQGVSS